VHPGGIPGALEPQRWLRRFDRRSDVARTFGCGTPLDDRSYLVGAVGTAVLTAPARNAVDDETLGKKR